MSLSDFDEWYENNPTSCDPKRSHLEGRVFALEWALKEIDVRLAHRNYHVKLKENIKEELEKYREGLI